MKMRNKLVLTVLGIIGFTAIAAGSYATVNKTSHVEGQTTQSTCIPSPCKSVAPVSQATSVPVASAPGLLRKDPQPLTTTSTSAPTTTTSEVPPPLPQELIDRIPSPEIDTPQKMAFCRETNQPYGKCRLPESDAMSEDHETTATDWVDQP